jgi:hypothetical protein
MIDKDVINLQQERLLARVCEKRSKDHVPKLTGILRNVLCYEMDVIKTALGCNLGPQIWELASSVDLKNPHPDIFNLCDGQLVGDEISSFSRVASDLLNLSQYAKTSKMCASVLDCIQFPINRHPAYKMISGVVGNPITNLMNVRFLIDQSDRDAVRGYKEIQSVGLSELYKRGETMWEETPNDFSCYFRGNNIYELDLNEAYKRLHHLKMFNLPDMAGQVEDYIKDTKDRIRLDRYYEFNKIKLSTAAIILAKNIGVKYTVKTVPYGQHTAKSYVDREWLGISSLTTDEFEYRPQLYPFYRLKSSERIQETVEFLEAFPQIGKKPLFDHYRVLLPSFHTMDSDDWNIQLIRQHRSLGVLLGERDGDHYFICYWEPQYGTFN